MKISFEIIGDPKPQGSKTAFRVGKHARVKEVNSLDHATWRNQVAQVARDLAEHDDVPAPLDGVLTLNVTFRFAMPKSRPKRIRDMVAASGYAPKTTAPDTSKLVRALEDGLQAGGLITDDARIAYLTAAKVETTGWTGADVTIAYQQPGDPS